MAVKYGLWNAEDKVWLGTNDGPNLYDDEDIARCAAEAVDWCCGWEPGSTKAVPYDGSATKLRDEVNMKKGRTPFKWVERKERGTIV